MGSPKENARGAGRRLEGSVARRGGESGFGTALPDDVRRQSWPWSTCLDAPLGPARRQGVRMQLGDLCPARGLKPWVSCDRGRLALVASRHAPIDFPSTLDKVPGRVSPVPNRTGVSFMPRPIVAGVFGLIMVLGVAAVSKGQLAPCGASSEPSPAGASEVALDDDAPPEAVPQSPTPPPRPYLPPIQPLPGPPIQPGQPGVRPAVAAILARLDALKAKRQAIDHAAGSPLG